MADEIIGVKLTFGSSVMEVPDSGQDRAEAVQTVAILDFFEEGFGYGEIAITSTPAGTFIDGETMSRERIKKYVNKLIDDAILDTDDDPERHKLFNRECGRTCSDRCKICHD